MAVATRSPYFWWQMPVPPLCPKCGVACKVTSTANGVQYRKCPKCGHRKKTTVAR